MFKFDFPKSDSYCENKKNNEKSEKENPLNWLEAKKIDIPLKYNKKNGENINHVLNSGITDLPLKIVDSTNVLITLIKENCENIIEAESQHSDLLPAKYEGGLKVWECTYDLGNYLLTENIPLNNKTVLDLGCGAGIIGLIALLRGATVYFQDYNAEVIESLTIPNVILNCDDEVVKNKCKFYSGDWESFRNLIETDDESRKYDYIFTSETIYNPDNYDKLYQIFKQKLKKTGIGFIAGKTYYFGVGGGMRQFEEHILRDDVFNVKVVWRSTEGLQREILILERKTL